MVRSAVMLAETPQQRSQTIEDEWTVVVYLSDDVWYQDNGLPGFCYFAIYEVAGRMGDDNALVYSTTGDSTGEFVTDPTDAPPEARGSIKWDGCMNWQTDETCMVHHCTPRSAMGFTAALLAAYEMAATWMEVDW